MHAAVLAKSNVSEVRAAVPEWDELQEAVWHGAVRDGHPVLVAAHTIAKVFRSDMNSEYLTVDWDFDTDPRVADFVADIDRWVHTNISSSLWIGEVVAAEVAALVSLQADDSVEAVHTLTSLAEGWSAVARLLNRPPGVAQRRGHPKRLRAVSSLPEQVGVCRSSA